MDSAPARNNVRFAPKATSPILKVAQIKSPARGATAVLDEVFGTHKSKIFPTHVSRTTGTTPPVQHTRGSRPARRANFASTLRGATAAANRAIGPHNAGRIRKRHLLIS